MDLEVGGSSPLSHPFYSSNLRVRMPMTSFESKLFNIGGLTLVRLPINESKKLPSRGMVMVKGTINGSPIQVPLEPDGKGSHWFKLEETTLKTIGVSAGDTVTLSLEPIKDWPEPQIPEDLKNALNSNSKANVIWLDTTPVARWDWIRWINATKNPETRKKRIETTCSKLSSGMRRPCCFNRSMCTNPYVSNNGVLLDSISPKP